MQRVIGALIIVLLLLLGGGGAWVYYAPIYIAKEAVKMELNDPASAQFRNIRRVSVVAVCGEVNAKNRMGGYVGFTPFYVLNTSLMISPYGFVEALWSAPSRDMVFVTIGRDISSLSTELDRRIGSIENEHIKKSCE